MKIHREVRGIFILPVKSNLLYQRKGSIYEQGKQNGHNADTETDFEYVAADNGVNACTGTVQHCRQRICREIQREVHNSNIARIPDTVADDSVFSRNERWYELAFVAPFGREKI
jgi:hypothetical protein